VFEYYYFQLSYGCFSSSISDLYLHWRHLVSSPICLIDEYLINTGYACFTSCSLNYFVYAFDIGNNSTNEFIPGTDLYCNNCNFYYDFNYYYDCNFCYFSIDVKRVYFSCHTTMHAMLMLYNAMLNYRINVSFDLLLFLEESRKFPTFLLSSEKFPTFAVCK